MNAIFHFALAPLLLLVAARRRVAEEVLLYLVRLLEDLELDAGSAGLKPGQLWGCKVVDDPAGPGGSTGGGGGTGGGGEGSSAPGGAVALEPGSDAELAVLVAAAAAAVVAFLRETQQLHRGARGSEKVG